MIPLYLVGFRSPHQYFNLYPHRCAAFAVNGVMKPFSDVTDEDTELMTPDEYTTYYEVLQSRS
jgi:hypothetical protein